MILKLFFALVTNHKNKTEFNRALLGYTDAQRLHPKQRILKEL